MACEVLIRQHGLQPISMKSPPRIALGGAPGAPRPSAAPAPLGGFPCSLPLGLNPVPRRGQRPPPTPPTARRGRSQGQGKTGLGGWRAPPLVSLREGRRPPRPPRRSP